VWFFRYASGQTKKQTDKHTDTLITILRNRTVCVTTTCIAVTSYVLDWDCFNFAILAAYT